MKKKISLLICSALSLGLLCSCGIEPAEDFDSSPVENAYNNYHNGGKLAFKDGNLYLVNTFLDNAESGVYKINADGFENFYPLDSFTDDTFPEFMSLYNTDGKFYAKNLNENKLCIFDESSKSFNSSEYDLKLENNSFYLGKDYVVAPDSFNEDGVELKVVKDGKSQKIDYTFVNYYIADDKIYGSGTDEKMCCYDISSEKFDEVAKVWIDPMTDKFFAANGYCYSHDETGSSGTGFYRHDVKQGTELLLTDKTVNAINGYESKVYLSTDDGIYCFDGTNTARISDLKADELYIVDSDWLYALNTKTGELYRISMGNGKTEVVNWFSPGSADQAK